MNQNNINFQETSYTTETRVSRRKGTGGTQEFFTPSTLVKTMCDRIPIETWKDPNKSYLEPSFGNGNFIVEMIRRRIENYGINYIQVLETTYGVELMEDNVIETYDRIVELLKTLLDNIDEDRCREIMKRNLVCSNFFRWNFEEWRPMSDEEYYNTIEGKKERAKLQKEKKEKEKQEQKKRNEGKFVGNFFE